MSNVRALFVTSLALVLAATPFARAQQTQGQQPAMSAEQQAMMAAWARSMAVGEPHQRLARMAGEWDMTTKAWMAPGEPPQVTKGTVTNTMLLGGRVLQSQHKGEMMGQPFEGLGLTGYDNVTGRYWTIWIDNMSTGLFQAPGSFDPAANTYTYTGEMADPMKPASMVKVRAVTRVTGPDSYVFEWYDTHEGKEMRSLEVSYTRRK
jgi:hypothetical protein